MFSCRDKHIRKKYSRPCTTLWKGFSRNVSLWYSMCSLKTLSDIIDLLHKYHFKCVEKACPLNVSLWKLKLLQSVWHQIVSDRWSGKPQRHILWPLLWKKNCISNQFEFTQAVTHWRKTDHLLSVWLHIIGSRQSVTAHRGPRWGEAFMQKWFF